MYLLYESYTNLHSAKDATTRHINEAPVFSSAQILSTVQDPEVDEASGLAASRVHAGVLYTHNDKGGSSRLFALDSKTGATLAILKIAHVANYDWEDVAVGPCGSHSCVYIAETGDHGGDGARNVIYRVREPDEIKTQTLHVESQLMFKWDEPDCETIMVTPNEDIYLISKVVGGHGLIANFSSSGFGSGQVVTAESSKYLTLDSIHHDPVGGDISFNGKEMLIKYKLNVYYWTVLDGDYIGATTRPPVNLPYVFETRGESVCWDPQGSGYYTTGEGLNQHIYYYKRQSPIIG
ncbi:uncharacterized protein LOC126817721 [Patella vulgata]|uniref:uncharacterized protein LOC126817721 n=1 Tax=Patella vulgata TaxID=6465 RepID=UPI0021802222|nr:uncharacterized protein LOC126817721 [Patella vulgata]